MPQKNLNGFFCGISYFMGLISLMLQLFLLLQLLQPLHFPFFMSEKAFFPAKNNIAANINPTTTVDAMNFSYLKKYVSYPHV